MNHEITSFHSPINIFHFMHVIEFFRRFHFIYTDLHTQMNKKEIEDFLCCSE